MTPPAQPARRWVSSALRALLAHPSLWLVGIRQAGLLAGPGWWRRPPFLPLPAPDYLRFRMETAYGGAGDQAPRPQDLITYLRWCKEFPGR